MKKKYCPPIAVNFVWNPSDEEVVLGIVDELKMNLARDPERPFSRSLNIPLFFFSSLNSKTPPTDVPEILASKNIIFVFTSTNTVGNPEWKNYIESLPIQESCHIVPIAIDCYGYNHQGSLSGLNCLRKSDWGEELVAQYALVSIAHEVYRFGCVGDEGSVTGIESSISIFLSHAKAGDTGRLISEQLKLFIDNTNMRRFFDANEISPAYHFDQEIENHIKKSTLLAIETDAYSSRYWCQKEILLAKKNNRPIIVVNSLEKFEDRIFPAASNVPCVHISSQTPIEDIDILRILSAVIIETIRHCYSIENLNQFKNAGWIDQDCEIAARPPEIRQILDLKNRQINKICYPEPPIYSDEADWHELIEISAFTPLWKETDQQVLKDKRIGISISDPVMESYSESHIHPDHLVRLSQDLARHLLARSATILYGGDLRKDGFTEFILDEAKILQERIKATIPHVENHLAWPLYVSDADIVAWRAKYNQVMNTIEYNLPADVSEGVEKDRFLIPNSTYSLYVWSRSLTEMRKSSISSSSYRICVGGKTSGFKGKMPGVLEEIMIALEQEKPLFLLGAFGGVAGDVCSVLLGEGIPTTLTEGWQNANNDGYVDLQNYAAAFGNKCNYAEIVTRLSQIEISELADRCNLNEEEYKRLMLSPFIDECIHLVLKSLSH